MLIVICNEFWHNIFFFFCRLSRSRTFKPVLAGSAALLSWIRPRGFWAFLSAI